MHIDVFTPVPHAFGWLTEQRPLATVLGTEVDLRLFGYRDTTPLANGQIDDAPYGGGPGMVLRVDVAAAALEAVYGGVPEHRVVALTPQGRQLDQAVVEELAAEEHLTLLSARFEGFDERILTHLCSDAISIGPYVLSGGELPAMVVVDAIARLQPGALSEGSAERETFSAELEGGVEFPHYTRPAEFRGWTVPDVLRSGDHGRIEEWRLEQSRVRERRVRSFYDVLGVEPGASEDEIRDAYYRRLRFDDVETEEGNARMRELREAYEVLSDPDRRRSYDVSRASREQPTSAWAASPPPEQPSTWDQSTPAWPPPQDQSSAEYGPEPQPTQDHGHTWNPVTRATRNLPRGWRITIDWIVTIVGAIAIVLAIKAWVVNPYRIPSSSMEPTLHCARPGSGCEARFSDRVLANRFIYHFRSPKRGDIIVFKTPPLAKARCGAGGTFVKRLIALPGETWQEKSGWIYINGKKLIESYIKPGRRDTGTSYPARVIPKGMYFMMGDNRTQSCDSREWGPVPRGNLIGEVFAVYWPPNRIGFR